MRDYFECTKVGVEFLQQTKNVFVSVEIIKATPEQIFEVFEDAHSWTVWAMPIQKVDWTSPKPYGIGTTRSVHMMFLTRPIMRFVNRRMFRKFKQYTETYAADAMVTPS